MGTGGVDTEITVECGVLRSRGEGIREEIQTACEALEKWYLQCRGEFATKLRQWMHRTKVYKTRL